MARIKPRFLNGQLVTDTQHGDTYRYRHDRDKERVPHLRIATQHERRNYMQHIASMPRRRPL